MRRPDPRRWADGPGPGGGSRTESPKWWRHSAAISLGEGGCMVHPRHGVNPGITGDQLRHHRGSTTASQGVNPGITGDQLRHHRGVNYGITGGQRRHHRGSAPASQGSTPGIASARTCGRALATSRSCSETSCAAAAAAAVSGRVAGPRTLCAPQSPLRLRTPCRRSQAPRQHAARASVRQVPPHRSKDSHEPGPNGC